MGDTSSCLAHLALVLTDSLGHTMGKSTVRVKPHPKTTLCLRSKSVFDFQGPALFLDGTSGFRKHGSIDWMISKDSNSKGILEVCLGLPAAILSRRITAYGREKFLAYILVIFEGADKCPSKILIPTDPRQKLGRPCKIFGHTHSIFASPSSSEASGSSPLSDSLPQPFFLVVFGFFRLGLSASLSAPSLFFSDGFRTRAGGFLAGASTLGALEALALVVVGMLQRRH